jgi:NADPH:quinone reductase-like Zn-dependent oxidoreductase
VTGFKPGDRVFAITQFYGQASHVVVPVQYVQPLPEAFSFDEGAALPVNYLTAFHMLFYVANLRPGTTMLLHMAAGGVGLSVIDLVRTVPNVRILGTASESKHELLKKLGVEPIDYRNKDYVEEVKRMTDGRGVQLILDPLGGPDWAKNYSLLRPAGQLVCFGWANMVSGEKRNLLHVVTQFLGMKKWSPFKLTNENKTVSGVNLGGLWNELDLLKGHLDAMMKLAAQGKLKPHVDSVFPLSKGADAHRQMSGRKNVGKVLFDCEA